MSDLAQRLGFDDDDRIVIVSCDDLGLSQSTNTGVYRALRDGVATTAGLMVPAPWSREAAGRYRGEDVGVHLTLTAEFDRYRWAPITHAPSLLDGDGGFPRTVVDAWEHADPAEVRRECRAQIERAILWGFDVSHLDSHMAILERRPEMFDVHLDMAVEYRLPLRLPDETKQRSVGFPFRRLAADEGVLFPDRVVHCGTYEALERVVGDLVPGVTEVHLLVAEDTPELRALAPDWADRVAALDLITSVEARSLFTRSGVTRIGYRALRNAQRAA